MCAPEVKEIEKCLEVYNEIVGGYIEVIHYPADDIICVLNEEGKLMNNLPFNFTISRDYIVGDVFFCGYNDDCGLASLSDVQIEVIMNRFKYSDI